MPGPVSRDDPGPRQNAGGVLAVIPARAGSKGVPGKNVALIAGRPLVDFTVATMLDAPSVSGIILTTDDNEILARYEGVAAIHLVRRPDCLATDTATTSDAVAHALEEWTARGNALPPILLLAQPTTPLRTVADIEAAIVTFRASRADSLISACLVEGMRHPMDMYRLDAAGRGSAFLPEGEGLHLRATYEPLYQRNGAIYMVTTEFFLQTGRLRSANPVVYEMPWERSINIDAPGDLVIAKALIESGLVK